MHYGPETPCRTAAGDDRAAFASLYYVVSSMIVSHFYRLLIENHGFSKPEDLRQGQLAVFDDMRYSHPRSWVPYLIIGNWR